MALSWCKVASNLDSHPKIRRAGRNGREVFLFALRRNAEPGHETPGYLDAADLDPDYLGDMLMVTRDEAVTGVTAAVTAGLLQQTEGKYRIVGWSEDWGKTGGSPGADRTKRWRERQKNKALDSSVTSHVTGVTSPNVTRDDGDACDGLEETRSDKSIPSVPREQKERKKSAAPLPADWAPTSEHQDLARERGVDLSLEARRFRAHADANDRRAVRWNGAFAQWLLKATPERRVAQTEIRTNLQPF